MVKTAKTGILKKFGKHSKNPGTIAVSGFYCGASDLTRTGDLLITSEMHYRLCYTSRATQPDYYNGRQGKCQLLFPRFPGKAALASVFPSKNTAGFTLSLCRKDPAPGFSPGWTANPRRSPAAWSHPAGGRKDDKRPSSRNLPCAPTGHAAG